MLEKGGQVKTRRFNPIVVILTIALVAALVAAGYFYFQSQKTKESAKTTKNAPKTTTRTIPTPLVTQPSSGQMTYNEFKTVDGKFSFVYPSTWTQIDIKNLETMIPKELIDKNELKIPLLLTDPTGGRLVLTTYRFDKSKDLNKIMDEIKADSAKMGTPYEEISRKASGNSLIVDYKMKTSGVTMMGHDLVFLSAGTAKNDVYIISLSALESTWNNFDPIFTRVQSSARLSE